MPDGFEQTVGELFCGPGGLSLGLKRAGFQPVWAIDSDQEACKTYRANIGAHVVCARTEDVDFSRFGKVDGLAFGFPCNDFSQVGEQKGTSGYYGGLYRHAVRALEELNPLWFIAENVPGILHGEGATIMSNFAHVGPGYSVSEHLYKFQDYGVPQRRHRIVAVGIRSDSGLVFEPPAPSGGRVVTAEEALEGVEAVPHNNRRTNHTEKVVRMLSYIPEGENAWYEGIPEELRLNVPNCRLSVIYRRLRRDEPSYTVTGSGGGGTHMYHYSENRALTNRERARLQSFPDDFVFYGTKEGVRRQIGMAVPPLGAQRIGEALRATLQESSYDSIKPSLGLSTPFEEEQLELMRA